MNRHLFTRSNHNAHAPHNSHGGPDALTTNLCKVLEGISCKTRSWIKTCSSNRLMIIPNWAILQSGGRISYDKTHSTCAGISQPVLIILMQIPSPVGWSERYLQTESKRNVAWTMRVAVHCDLFAVQCRIFYFRGTFIETTRKHHKLHKHPSKHHPRRPFSPEMAPAVRLPVGFQRFQSKHRLPIDRPHLRTECLHNGPWFEAPTIVSTRGSELVQPHEMEGPDRLVLSFEAHAIKHKERVGMGENGHSHVVFLFPHVLLTYSSKGLRKVVASDISTWR